MQPVLRVSGRFLRLLTARRARIEAATACRDVADMGEWANSICDVAGVEDRLIPL